MQTLQRQMNTVLTKDLFYAIPITLILLVQNAILNGEKVKAFGSRHSISDIICTDGIPISMANINHNKINDDGRATFGAGLEMYEALEFLEMNKLSLNNVPTFGMQLKRFLGF